MEEDQTIGEKVYQTFIQNYNLDKLCPKCGGLLEKINEIHCEKCKILGDLRDYITRIELGVMQIRNRAGLSRKDLEALVINYQKNTDNNFVVGGDPGDEIPNYLK